MKAKSNFYIAKLIRKCQRVRMNRVYKNGDDDFGDDFGSPR